MKDPKNPDKIVIDLEDLADDNGGERYSNQAGSISGTSRGKNLNAQGMTGNVKYCANCGFKLSAGAQSCPQCGNTVYKERFSQLDETFDRVAQFSKRGLPQGEASFSGSGARFISPGILVFTFLCLFFPFISITGVTLSGFNMAFGLDSGFGFRVGGHWAGVLLFLVILAGIGLSFWQNSNQSKILVALSAFGLLLLLGLAIGINNYLSSELGYFSSFFELKMGAGFYLMFLSFIAIAAVNIYFLKSIRN